MKESHRIMRLVTTRGRQPRQHPPLSRRPFPDPQRRSEARGISSFAEKYVSLPAAETTVYGKESGRYTPDQTVFRDQGAASRSAAAVPGRRFL